MGRGTGNKSKQSIGRGHHNFGEITIYRSLQGSSVRTVRKLKIFSLVTKLSKLAYRLCVPSKVVNIFCLVETKYT